MAQFEHSDTPDKTEASTPKSSSKWLGYVVIVLVVVIAGAYLVNDGGLDLFTGQGQASGDSGGAGLKVGAVAPDFALKDLSGNEVKLSDYRGKVVMLNFWATWCPPCRYEMPFIESVYKEQADKGFVVIAVSIDEEPAAVPEFAKEFGLTFPIVIDTPQQQVANKYRLYPIPTSYFIDKDGVIRDAHVGAMEKKNILKILQKLM